MSDTEFLRGVAAAAREQARKLEALAEGAGRPPAVIAEAQELRRKADRIDSIAGAPPAPAGTDWLGPCDDGPQPAHARGSRWGDAALAFGGAIVGALFGAAACGCGL